VADGDAEAAGEAVAVVTGDGVAITGTGGGGSSSTAAPTARPPTRIPASKPVPIASLLPMQHERTSTFG